MARVIIQNLFKKTIDINDYSKSLLKNFQENGIDWMYACGGKGRCTTCRLIVVEGETNLQPLTASEEKYRSQGALKEHERLACQVRPRQDDLEGGPPGGDILILVPKDTQLPHMHYSDG